MPRNLLKHSKKTRKSKVGAISKAQKAQISFFEEQREIFEICFPQKTSHSTEKCKEGTLWGLLTYIQLQNIKRLEEGPFRDNGKFSEKSHGAEKIQNVDPLEKFCWLHWKVKNESGSLRTKFVLALD